MPRRCPGSESDRGAVLIHVAFVVLMLVAFTTFVVDWGVLWLSRGQAQNSADSGALAGAIALGFDDPNDLTDTGAGKLNAYQATQNNLVYGQPPDVNVTTDVTFPACPDGIGQCIRVDVYRNQTRNNPLPIMFGTLVGLTDQGIRATATARIRAANATECLRPWAIVDRWDETAPNYPSPDPDWDFGDTYDAATGDLYVPPSPTAPGTGFTLADYGLQFAVKMGAAGQGGQIVSPGWFQAIDIPRVNSCANQGASAYECNIATCGGVTTAYAPFGGTACPEDIPVGDEAFWAERGCYRVQTGNMVGPTRDGVQTLMDRDPNAGWSDGRIVNSQYDPPSSSPRIVPIGVLDIDLYMAQNPTGQNGIVRLVNIFGFFIEGLGDTDALGNITCCSTGGQAVVGRLVTIPGDVLTTGGDVGPSAFLKQIVLIR
jgi:hypothetical protein